MTFLKRTFSPAVRAVLVAALGVVMVACQPDKAETARPDPATAVMAPSFSAPALDGSLVSTADLEGKAYIVNFFASYCPPCRNELPDMVRLQSEYADQGFTFIGIAVNEDRDRMHAFIDEMGINYPVIMVTQEIVDAYNRYADGGIKYIPTSFVIDANGMLSSYAVGEQSYEVFRDLIVEAIEAGR